MIMFEFVKSRVYDKTLVEIDVLRYDDIVFNCLAFDENLGFTINPSRVCHTILKVILKL